MKKVVVCFMFAAGILFQGFADAENIRTPWAAGRFYPSDVSELKKTVDRFLKNAVKPLGEKPLAIISPHAGYIYSGQIAADAFNQAAGYKYNVIVLLGVNHTSPAFAGVSVYPGDYETPLGIAKTDKELLENLIASGKDVVTEEAVHIREHSIEVLLPFVQTLFPGLRIIAAVVGTPDPELCARFGNTLAKVLKDRNPLIAASSDLSHYPSYQDAVRVDKETLDAVMKIDPNAFQSVLRKQETKGIGNLDTCACGEATILTVMAAAKALGANCGRLISYANSGDVSGDRSRVVGYGAVMFSASCSDPKN